MNETKIYRLEFKTKATPHTSKNNERKIKDERYFLFNDWFISINLLGSTRFIDSQIHGHHITKF